MRYAAVLNREGGRLRTLDVEGFCERAKQIFEYHGHQFSYEIVNGAAIVTALTRTAQRDDIDAVLAGGGDGTISAAAGIAFEQDMVLAVLPAGTMNMFARALGLPLDLELAIQALAQGQVQKVDIATANGRPFVHQFGVGLHPRLVRIRETMTYRSQIGKMVASLRAIAWAVARPPNFGVQIGDPEGTMNSRASAISVSNNLLEDGHLPYAERVEGGVLGVYIAAPMSPLGLVKLAFDVLRGRWRDSPMVSERASASLVLSFAKHRGSAKAVVDGEIIDLAQRVDFKLHQGGLKVVIPTPELAQSRQ